MKKLGLLPRLLIGIAAGITIGALNIEFLTRLLVTFSGLFGNFLGYAIPFLVLAFIVPGIAELGTKAGKLLGITVGIAYLSTLLAGIFAYVAAITILPLVITPGGEAAIAGEVVAPFFTIELAPVMPIMTALVTAFVLGLGISVTGSTSMLGVMQDFQNIIKKVIENIIIPFLPFHIAGIFSEMAFTGEIVGVLAVFSGVFIFTLILHYAFIMIQYTIAGAVSKSNPFAAIKKMLPAYFTAIGTQSSAATIPVTLKSIKTLKVSEQVAEFVAPLGAATHLSGSTISLVVCAMAVIFLEGGTLSTMQVISFIMMLGVTMVAAPGVPGGAVMAALGLLESMLGFTEGQLGIMMAIYIAQDSFGTAANVSADGAVALIVNKIAGKDTKEKEESMPKAA